MAAGWTPLREPGAKSYSTMAVAMSLPFVLGAFLLLLHNREIWRPLLRAHHWELAGFVLLLLILVPLHEGVHAIAYGCGLRSPHLIAGCWWRRGLAYVLYDAPLPRRRVLIMMVAPFFVLTICPLLALSLASAAGQSFILFFAILHAAICTGDFNTFVRLLHSTPPRAWIHNQGWTTCWRADYQPPLG
jgi:hypothetical protein